MDVDPAGRLAIARHAARIGQVGRARRHPAQLAQVAVAAHDPGLAVAGDGHVAEIQHLGHVFGRVDGQHRLRQRVVVDRLQRLDGRKLGARIHVVVEVDRLEAIGRIGHLQRFDQAIEAIVWTGPIIGIDVLVLIGGEDLVSAGPLVDAQRRDLGPRRRAAGDGGIAAVDVDHAGVPRHAYRELRRPAVARPLNDLDPLVRRRQPRVDIADGAADLPLQVELVAGDGQREGGVAPAPLALGGSARERAAPLERVRIGMRAELDVGQREHLPGDRLQARRELGVQAAGAHLALDDRQRGRDAVPLPDLLHQHLAGILGAGKLGARGETVAVHVDHHQAPAVLGRHIRNRHVRQRQRPAQEFERLDHPARLLDRPQREYRVWVEHIAAPRRDGGGVEFEIARLQAQQRLPVRAHPDRLRGAPVRPGRHLEADDPVLRHHRQRPGGVAAHQLQAEHVGHAAVRRQAELVHEGDAHAVVDALSHPGRQRRRLPDRTGIDPHHHAGIAVGRHVGRQRLVEVGVIDVVAEEVEGHGQEAHALAGVDVCARGAVLQDQHLARQHLDAPDPDRRQRRIGHIRDQPLRLDALGGLARAGAVGRRAIVDGNDRQVVFVLDLARLAHQPRAVGVVDLPVLLVALVPGAVQRLEGHRVRQIVHLRQDLEAAIEDQLRLRIARLDGADHPHHAGLLRCPRGIVLGDQLVRIEGIEEEAAIAPVPQRRDDTVDVERGPLRLGLVDHVRGPRRIAASQPGLGQFLVPAALGRDLAYAHVGEPLCRGGLGA